MSSGRCSLLELHAGSNDGNPTCRALEKSKDTLDDEKKLAGLEVLVKNWRNS